MNEMIKFALREQEAGRSRAQILDCLEAVYCLTDKQAHAVMAEAIDGKPAAGPREYECGIRYTVCPGYGGPMITKERLFEGRTLEEAHSKRQRFCNRIEQTATFCQFDSWYN